MLEHDVKVWDVFVRIFHWALVLTFTIAYFTEDDLLNWHVYAGYAVAVLVLMRLLWGFIGTRYARFSDFVYRPATVKAYVEDILKLKAKRYLGHNPAGGAMIVLMLLVLVLVSLSGIAVYGIEEAAGPLAMLAESPGRLEDILEELHEILSNLMVMLVVIHVAGVMVESWIHRESLVRAMLNGRKRA